MVRQRLTSKWQSLSQRMKERWEQLTEQERKVVSIGGIVVFLLLFYALYWSPVMDAVEKTRKRITSSERMLAWMRVADAKLQSDKHQQQSEAQQVTPVALMSVLQKQINENALGQSLKELKQASNDTIDIKFQQVRFDKVMVFLINTMKSYRVTVQQLTAKSGDQPGIVDLELVLKL